jgi:transposase-like protein
MEQLCGFDVTSMQVSRATQQLDDILEKWRTRPLKETSYPYLILDARYEKVRLQGCVQSCAVLIAVGIDNAGKRAVLGTSVAFSEAEVHWRDFIESLQSRGLHGVEYAVSDDHAGLKAALQTRLPNIKWQRCQFHLQQNASKYVPRLNMRKPLANGLRDVLQADDLEIATARLQALADRYRPKLPALSGWLEENVPESLTVLTLPEDHQRRLRTSNSLENLNRQIKRRTRVANIFPNEASLLRLVSAILMEISEEWETGKRYLTFSGVLKDPS